MLYNLSFDNIKVKRKDDGKRDNCCLSFFKWLMLLAQ